MTDTQKLDLILSEIQGIKAETQGTKSEIQGLKTEIQGLKSEAQNTKSEIQGLKTEIQDIKTEIQGLKSKMQDVETEIQELKRRTTSIELHLENDTDKNIQLIAENFIELTNKLNQAIPAADKNLAYEVKVNYLLREVDRLKEEIAEIKNKIA